LRFAVKKPIMCKDVCSGEANYHSKEFHMTKGFSLLTGLLALSLTLSGCAAPQTQAERGAVYGTGIGAAAGAGLGQAIGRDTKSTVIGAGIGAVVGGLAGGSIGRYMDEQEAAMRSQMAQVEGASIQREANLLAVNFRSEVLFDTNSATLKAGAYNEINRVAGVLNQYPQTTLLIAGHTDSTGSESYNQQLSERRAQSVQQALVAAGVNPGRMTAVGYGQSQPIADNRTEAGRQLNRRVTINITPQG
jgi:outer membrane protein OmpA-like peptidoglycan-associated protein